LKCLRVTNCKMNMITLVSNLSVRLWMSPIWKIHCLARLTNYSLSNNWPVPVTWHLLKHNNGCKPTKKYFWNLQLSIHLIGFLKMLIWTLVRAHCKLKFQKSKEMWSICHLGKRWWIFISLMFQNSNRCVFCLVRLILWSNKSSRLKI